MTRLRLVMLSALAVTCACGGASDNRARALQDENRRLRNDLTAADQALAGAMAYRQQLEAPNTGSMSLLLNADDIDRLSQAALPHRIPAREFHSQVSGEVLVERVTNVRFYPGNKFTCQVHLRGVGLRFQGQIPAPYKAQVGRFLEGVMAGVVTDLDVTLTTQNNQLIARAVAKRSQMKRNHDASNASRLTQGMNDRALRKGLAFDLTPEGAPWKLKHVAMTATHLVLGYGP